MNQDKVNNFLLILVAVAISNQGGSQQQANEKILQTQRECMTSGSFIDRYAYVFALVNQGKTDEEIRRLLSVAGETCIYLPRV
jgi:hypothetical protein